MLLRSGKTCGERYGPRVLQAAQTAATLAAVVVETLPYLHDILKELQRDVDRFGVVMLELGWPPPTDIDFTAWRALLQCYDEHGAEVAQVYVDADMLRYFGEVELRALLSVWAQNPLLAGRMPILEQVIEAHLAGM